MNVKTLCLAILYDGNASGYEIRKLSTEGEYAYFVEASFGSIYPALAKLEDEGLVTGHIENQDGRPAKKVYEITAAGRKSFRESLFDTLDADVYRSEFLMFAHFVNILPRSLVETRLRQKVIELDNQLCEFKRLAEKKCGPTDEWIVNYGTECMRVARDYVVTHMDKLVALAQPDDKQADAAE